MKREVRRGRVRIKRRFWEKAAAAGVSNEAQIWPCQSNLSYPALHHFYRRLRLVFQFADRSKYMNEHKKLSHIARFRPNWVET